ncbi:hypothetical protein O6H91_08G026600 [Diphasiastrum complanatum]|nr:hypothetical protein O6H91_08G026600 [Diphasiastrum complanatum]
MALLGEDGSGYELARRLDESCAWRAWLGDADYELLRPHLSSLAAWRRFLRSEAEPAYEHLQLRARALLYDRALGCLFLNSSDAISSTQLDPSYLQLQADDVYFSLERDAYDWAKYGVDSSKCVSKLDLSLVRHSDAEEERQSYACVQVSSEAPSNSGEVGNADSSSNGCLWYDQWLEKNLAKRMNRLARRFDQRKLPFGEQEACVRTPEKMSAYIVFSMQARRRHQVLRLDRDACISVIEDDLTGDRDRLSNPPEIMLPGNCVPDNPIPIKRKREDFGKNASAGLLDPLERLTFVNLSSKEKLARRSDRENPGIFRKERVIAGTEKEKVSEHAAQCLVRQTVARLVAAAGFDGLKQGALDLLCELFVCHIRKLGRGLRLILDSYQRHYTPAELLRMYLHTAGGSSSNVRSLVEYLRNEINISAQVDQPQQYKTSNVQQSSPHSQGPQRQISPQVQFLHQQNLLQQQQPQLDRFARRRQPSNLRSKKFDKDRMPADVRVDIDMTSEPLGTPNETTPFVSLLSPQSHQQWNPQQQQMLQIPQPHHPQVLQQFKQHGSSLQLPSMQQ